MKELIGNAAAAGALRATLDAGRTAHAYLLTGPPRVGKRTLAKLYAAGLVCESRPRRSPSHGTASTMPTLELGVEVTPPPPADPVDVPCGRCRACGLVQRDSHPDVRLTEPESGKRGIVIDQVRQLEHAAGLRPYEADVKVFIITEADAMTEAAANALLKTLEEPPEDSVLVLTASDVSQVLPTIASRCQEVPLRPVPSEEIARALEAKGAAPDRALLLARLAGGRPGWALAALEDEALLEKRTEHVELLEQLVGQPPVVRLPAAGAFADAAGAREALDVWQTWWRDALLVREGCEDLAINVDRLDRLRALRVTPESCWGAVRRLQSAREQVDANANVRLAMEALLLDLPAVAS
jgi:DNA polymerase III subunit delta'